MNPNLDFREPIEWGDSTIDPKTPINHKPLGIAAAIVTFVVAILVWI